MRVFRVMAVVGQVARDKQGGTVRRGKKSVKARVQYSARRQNGAVVPPGRGGRPGVARKQMRVGEQPELQQAAHSFLKSGFNGEMSGLRGIFLRFKEKAAALRA
jgi:hypothetical protein